MELVSPAPKEVFFTTPSEYLKTKTDRISFNPSTNYYISESKYFGLNWLVVWSISYVLTGGFLDEGSIDFKSYFGLKDAKGKPFKAQTWHDGVRAGVQFIAAHSKRVDENYPVDKILFPGTLEAMKNPSGFRNLEDLDKLFGEGFSAKVKATYDEVLAFAKGDEFEKPPSDGDVIPEVKPLPPEVVKPKPAPVSSDPNTPVAGWKKPLTWILGILSPVVLFFLGFVIPGPIMEIVKAVVALLKQIVGAN